MEKGIRVCFFIACLLFIQNIFSQKNLLLNGSFEDVNICTEYKAECGVEGWFYLKDIKVQMLANYDPILPLGQNSYALYYKWLGYNGFVPVIGTLLPCRLQKGKKYIFSGLISAKVDGRLRFRPGALAAEKFYVPNRHFSTNMRPDSIMELKSMERKNFYEFTYRFTATGNERYLTFGSFMAADTSTPGLRFFAATQTVSIIIDNFHLMPADSSETYCGSFWRNRDSIYNYNFRHKEMDYSLFGKGYVNIPLDETDSNFITGIEVPQKIAKPDTLKLGDVFFDFNKATLKPEAQSMLTNFFKPAEGANGIDSIYIEGHTDSIGTDSRNMQLSIQRCESVQAWLLDRQVLSPSAIQIHPFGKTKPIATNSTPRGRAANRRVEIIIFRKAK